MTDFEIENVEQIAESLRLIPRFEGTLTEGESLQSKLTQILTGNPSPGTVAARVKDVFQRTVPQGKIVRAYMQLAFTIEDA